MLLDRTAHALGTCCKLPSSHLTLWQILTIYSKYNGEAGVTQMLDMLYTDFRRCMQLCGCRTIADISTASLGIVRKDGPLARL